MLIVVFFYSDRPVHANFPPVEVHNTSQAFEWAKNSLYMERSVTRIGVYDLGSYFQDDNLRGKRSPCDLYILGIESGDSFGIMNLCGLAEVNKQKGLTSKELTAIPIYPDRHCLDMIGGQEREEADAIVAEALAGAIVNE